ncbi:bifunctional diaminohydroxyphosphoribosylaminopyrimidine deaminase/5-amino-6-(5-phosphoribosylamino)uracil reductase RibD [Legionella cardiaca]|uniref:Riboflavin biosynthesis protein RibD n=1 Tax=Legionella cardiaca TaxID=1071983 RepID=A0ABY8AV38_9GAMM|nr:bifunctional diaminohydroxyphosphoribosylaminopyrimidine deaminase/5-amino-6-(5-phosphoribosylamino)uracil reductase RibD [Legionella cardiaca]WED44555.1 bifunctional diaminohydroxyphosphoribosylaminopyrimidine deaminase/5-amino-6-(5-phosphoribosylamino)uracil reductase RibD [Legionella cardiaca]
MHNYFMLAALEQAWLGRGTCAPNPSVGAVVVHNGNIIARAWHHGAGSAHAEQLVLEQIPENLNDLTLYVTLEPCNHWGRTPPCVSAIIRHKVSRVIYGFRDPNPVVAANNTPELLQAAGIDVLHFPLTEIDNFYQSYRYWILTKKPWVTVKIAQSLDGKIAGVNGKRYQLSNNYCTEFTHQNRLHADVILTTAKTILNDDPLLNVRLKDKTQGKPLAILDRRLSLGPAARVFTSATHCHIYHEESRIVEAPFPNCSYHAVPTKNGMLDLAAVLADLGKLGYHDVWVEGGGALFSTLHRENLVQRTYLYLVPEVLGDNATPAFHSDAIFTQRKMVSWDIKADNIIARLDWQLEDSCSQD